MMLSNSMISISGITNLPLEIWIWITTEGEIFYSSLQLNLYNFSLASHETEKKAKQLSDIPVDIVEKIIKKASWKDV